MGFELEAWLMRNLSWGHDSNNHSRSRRDLIEINLVQWAIDSGPTKYGNRVFAAHINVLANAIFRQAR
jgi:hypothetical protein